jgi:LEA14-like dessication related protein
MQSIKKFLLLLLLLLLSACASLMSKPESPTVTLAGMEILAADFFEQRFALDLRLQNPNDFNLPIRGLRYELILNGKPLATGVSNQQVDLPAYGEQVIRVESVSSLLSIFKQVQSLGESKSGALDYQLKGHVSLLDKSFKLPFDKRGEISLR